MRWAIDGLGHVQRPFFGVQRTKCGMRTKAPRPAAF